MLVGCDLTQLVAVDCMQLFYQGTEQKARRFELVSIDVFHGNCHVCINFAQLREVSILRRRSSAWGQLQ